MESLALSIGNGLVLLLGYVLVLASIGVLTAGLAFLVFAIGQAIVHPFTNHTHECPKPPTYVGSGMAYHGDPYRTVATVSQMWDPDKALGTNFYKTASPVASSAIASAKKFVKKAGLAAKRKRK